MARYNTWKADAFRFEVHGRGAQNFLTAAQHRGIRLYHLHCTGEGYSGMANGADRPEMQNLAATGGWTLETLNRRGPGPILERLCRRPGIPVGLAVFLLLLWWFSGFVWVMDFSSLEPEQQTLLEEQLAEQQIWVGCRLDQERLGQVQELLSLQSETFGWLGLNFTGGCLFVESTPLQTQQVREEVQNTALYAAAGGQVVAIRVESGFGVVETGQYVAQGQLLANALKLDREGALVGQAATGSVLARVEKSYTATQPLQQTTRQLTGARSEEETLFLLGQTKVLREAESWPETRRTSRWIPLTLGRIALPGSIRQVTVWEEQEISQDYTPEEAQAMAERSCRLQLMAEFPDAVIENKSVTAKQQEQAVACTVCYTFVADIARQGPFTPLEPQEQEP